MADPCGQGAGTPARPAGRRIKRRSGMKAAKIDGKEVLFLKEPDVKVLGYAIWYTFSRTKAHKDIVREWFERHGLQEFAPGEPGHRDAFKRICSEYREKFLRKEKDDEVYLLIRPVDKKGDLRKMVLERRAAGKKLSYEVVGEIWYFKDEETGAEAVRFTIGAHDPDVEEVAEEIRRRWDEEKDCYTEETFRRVLLDIIEECGKVKLKPSGSVYFVPEKDFHYIEKFANIVEELKAEFPDNRTEIWYAPIMDTDQFREMVKMKVEDTLQEVLDSAIKKLLEVNEIEDEKERARRIREITRSIENAAKVAEKYAKLLKATLDRTQKLLEDARKIIEKVESSSEKESEPQEHA